MENQKFVEHEQASKISIGSRRDSSEKSGLENKQEAWRNRLAHNFWAVYITIYCMSLELPFDRYLFGKPLSVFLARIRFIGVVWIFTRLVLFLALSDCEYAAVRAYLYDWTIYYPSERRASIQRIFIGGIVYHLCLKLSVITHKRKAFDASLIDFLCAEPPSRSGSSHVSELDDWERSCTNCSMQSFNFPVSFAKSTSDQEGRVSGRRESLNRESNFLRDRSHWFELSDSLWIRFKTNALVVLPLCSLILMRANWRYSFVYPDTTRRCDIEMPQLHLVGSLELNFFLVECMETLIGSFSYCSMVKSDLLIQAKRVERYLAHLIADINLSANPSDHTIHSQAVDTLPTPLECDNLTKRLASISLPSDRRLLFGELHPRKIEELMSACEEPSRKTFGTVHTLKSAPVELTNQALECPQLYANCRQGNVPNSSHSFLFRGPMSELDQTNSMLLNSVEEAPVGRRAEKLATCRRLTSGIIGAQNEVILFLRCIDSHKQAMSFVGSSFLLWMVASISFVPLLIVSIRATPSEQVADIGYAISCVISLFVGLMFTYIGATVHKRATRLTSLLFRICSLYHSQAVDVRWNKIFMIWYCPSRCAFKVSGIFELTHLNMLKAISFLVSGLTLVLNYLD